MQKRSGKGHTPGAPGGYAQVVYWVFFFQTRLSFLFLLLNLNTVGDEMVFKVLFAQPYIQPTE